MAIPIRISGITSNSLFSTEHNDASQILFRYPLAYRNKRMSTLAEEEISVIEFV